MFTPQLNILLQNLPWHKESQITGMPCGYDVYALGKFIFSAQKPVGLIVKGIEELNLLEELFHLFYPALPCVSLPPWDCVPYDRLSPKSYISASRVKALAQLQILKKRSHKPWVFLTTPEGLIQKVPSSSSFVSKSVEVKSGDSFSREKLIQFCEAQGYRRVDTVYEPGDYALRGGLMDLYPSDANNPVRLDFFDVEVESIKTFNPATQRSDTVLDALKLGGISEVPYTESALHGFRKKYRETFGVPALRDNVVQSILAGRPMPGAEHWLPLFYDEMSSIRDYLPKSLQWIVQGEGIEAIAEKFLDEIDENYQRRNISPLDNEETYRALEPVKLYFSSKKWREWWTSVPKWSLQEGSYFTDAKHGYYNAGGLNGYDFSKERIGRTGIPKEERSRDLKTLYHHVVEYIKRQQAEGRICVVSGSSKGRVQRLKDALKDADRDIIFSPFEPLSKKKNNILTIVSSLEHGFVGEEFCFITDKDILGTIKRSIPSKIKRSPEELLSELSSFSEDDYVVHTEYGIGIYHGLKTLSISGFTHDFLELGYASGDKLLVPVEHLNMVTRYSDSDSVVTLDRMGSTAWRIKRQRVKKQLMDIADKLIKTAADRYVERVDSWLPLEGLYEEFCARFSYELTPDQQQAELDMLEDFSRGIPMDRLVCGDVGFGKTEIALRAAFVASSYKKQVCVVVPTTLLCRQHYKTFYDRFSSFGIKVGQISRLIKPAHVKAIKKSCQKGEIDIVISTHAAFGKGLEFKDLGLIILDEEQHFGVTQKELLKKKAPQVHILTLTATPIPRTLQLSLAGIRPMSLIATPPVDRLAVRTFVMPYDEMIIREALLREYYRGGQVFYVCPRLKDIGAVRKKLEELVPDMKIAVAHGKMNPADLEDVMQDFYDGIYTVLLSTNIVESGIDIPTANTLIIHRSDMFGLAQLYQLRGRVGRSKVRGYCYFTLSQGKVLTVNAKKRLKVMQSLDALGAGFSIATHDMDIRGAGNLVGEAQAGHVKEVGVDLYQKMLKEAVTTAKNKCTGEDLQEQKKLEVVSQINLGTDAYIPETYIEDLNLRLRLYRRLANCSQSEELYQLEEDFHDRFGPVPSEVKSMLELMQLKLLASQLNIEKIDTGPKGAIISFYKNTFSNSLGLIEYIMNKKGLLRLRPDHKLVLLNPMRDRNIRYPLVKNLLEELMLISES